MGYGIKMIWEQPNKGDTVNTYRTNYVDDLLRPLYNFLHATAIIQMLK